MVVVASAVLVVVSGTVVVSVVVVSVVVVASVTVVSVEFVVVELSLVSTIVAGIVTLEDIVTSPVVTVVLVVTTAGLLRIVILAFLSLYPLQLCPCPRPWVRIGSSSTTLLRLLCLLLTESDRSRDFPTFLVTILVTITLSSSAGFLTPLLFPESKEIRPYLFL